MEHADRSILMDLSIRIVINVIDLNEINVSL